MRTSLYALAAVAALAAPAALTATPVQASGNRPFCLHGGMTYGVYDCSYGSMAACRATASGNSASCDVNPAYLARGVVYDGDEYVERPRRRARRVRSY